MKRRTIIILGGLFLSGLLLLLGAFFFFNAFPGILRGNVTGPRDGLTSREAAELQDGDLIFRKGLGLPSDLIITALNDGTGVSHGGIIVHHSGVPWVVHTVSPGLSPADGVQSQTLVDFNRNSQEKSLVILRLRGAESSELGKKIRASALNWLERKIPFDNGYDFRDRSKMYCTELIWQVLEDAGFWRPEDRALWSGPILGFHTFLNTGIGRVVLDHRSATSEP